MPAWLTDEENEKKFTLTFTHKHKQCIGAMKNRFKAGIGDEKFTLTFTHKHKQCIGAMKNRFKAGIVH